MMWKLSKKTQRGCVGLVTRPEKNVSAASRKLNSSGKRGSGIPRMGMRATRVSRGKSVTAKTASLGCRAMYANHNPALEVWLARHRVGAKNHICTTPARMSNASTAGKKWSESLREISGMAEADEKQDYQFRAQESPAIRNAVTAGLVGKTTWRAYLKRPPPRTADPDPPGGWKPRPPPAKWM